MTSSSVRWSKTETSRLNTEEHDFKTNFRRSKNHQKFDLFHANVSEAPILPANVSPYNFNWRGYSAVTNDVQNQDPGNSVMIVCDEKLKEVFGYESISTMGIPKLLVRHHLLEQ
ncbi:unnamed protein product [Lactuca saligna]|uniref:DM2 domain-containing protein n=1 Tax=Lactuca saligna TaxID=75948 RepID=A0AA35Y424_LACSI|nr:unnamed protein product [Lactuca saligna]